MDTGEGIPGPALLVTSSDHMSNYAAGWMHTHRHADTCTHTLLCHIAICRHLWFKLFLTLCFWTLVKHFNNYVMDGQEILYRYCWPGEDIAPWLQWFRDFFLGTIRFTFLVLSVYTKFIFPSTPSPDILHASKCADVLFVQLHRVTNMAFYAKQISLICTQNINSLYK